MPHPDAIKRLFQQVYAHPEDDHIRRVLADALTEIGDPRGELISVQLDAALEDGVRAMRLIQRHGLSWLGPLRDFVLPVAYERGFIASVVVTGPVADCDEWATVHTVNLGAVKTFELYPSMRALRRLISPRRRLLIDLARRYPDRMRELSVEVAFAPALRSLLATALPTNAITELVVRHVPPLQPELELRAAAARHDRMRLDIRGLLIGQQT